MKNNSSKEKVLKIIRGNSDGLTITELVSLSKLSRSTVRVVLARLEGANKVSFRKIGMAKVYVVGGEI